VIALKSAARGAAVIGLALLSGCSFSWLPWSHKPAEACPAAVILEPLKHTAVLAAGRQPIPQNVAFYGIIDEVDSQCEYVSGAVRMKLAVVVIGERAPAAVAAKAVDLDYFLAVTGPGQTILSKTPFRVHIVFPPDKPRAGVTDHIEETIPLNGLKGSELTVDVGFQQSPEVVDFYRHFRGRL
jgi:hypothetical protein